MVGVAGIWKDLTDSVNQMASNLTSQVSGIAKVVTAVAKGNLRQKLSIEAKGEVARLTDTINEMIDTLAVFADQVTTVAREVGAEGKLGGQASVPGASGTWKDLTDNVNQLAANLTTQVRAISEVASAVTKGDLSRSINVEAMGEVEALKDTINQMISNLKATTLQNEEQDWLKSNLAKITQMLQGQKDLPSVSKLILSELAKVVSVQHGVFYIHSNGGQKPPTLKLLSSYAFNERKNVNYAFKLGEGLVGQCALEKERIKVERAPSNYIRINSGLGEAVSCDSNMIRQVWMNLVSNAIKYSSRKVKPRIHISGERKNGQSIFRVKDNGIEFDKKEAANLFKIVERLENSGGYDGTGVGLAIVKKIIDRHGGDIRVKSEVGKGSEFIFSL